MGNRLAKRRLAWCKIKWPRGGEGGWPFARQSNQWSGVLSSSAAALIGIKYNISHPFKYRCDFNIHYSVGGGGGGL